jgi:hypothetical protein
MMEDTRRAIACLVAGILLSIVTRVWYVSTASPDASFVLNGGLMLGLLLWLLGAFYGYRALSAERSTNT